MSVVVVASSLGKQNSLGDVAKVMKEWRWGRKKRQKRRVKESQRPDFA